MIGSVIILIFALELFTIWILQEKKPLKSLLKVEGIEEFKKRVWQSMHLRSDMEEEEGGGNELIRKLREVWNNCCSNVTGLT